MLESALRVLTEDDVRLFVRHSEPAVRAGAAQRICHKIRNRPSLSKAERAFARKILNHMSDDSAAMVRRALAVTLRNSPALPRDVAKKLAEDIDNIAVPILVNSPVFTDDDLIDVLKSKAAAKVIAVAKRPTVSEYIVKAIIRFGDSHAVAEVAANDGAEISLNTAQDILELYHDNDLIKESFITRRDLPVTILEKLITMVTEEAAILIQRRHSLPPEIAIDLATRTRERASLDFIDGTWSVHNVRLMTQRLQEEGRLTPRMIIRAVCSGQMSFTEHALACLAGISAAKSRLMIHDGGPFGLKALCARAGMTGHTFTIINAACAIYRDLEHAGLHYNRGYFQSLMLQRILTLPIALPKSEQDYFLEALDNVDAAATAV